MTPLGFRLLRSAYRREPLSGFIFAFGIADVALGGLHGHLPLATFGLAIVGIAVGLRRLQFQEAAAPPPEPSPQRYLPARSSQSQLPMLMAHRRRPPADRPFDD